MPPSQHTPSGPFEAIPPLHDQELSTLVEQAPDVVLRLDVAGRILYANRVTRQSLGLELSELRGRPMDEVPVPRELTELWSTTNEEVVRTGREKTIEFLFPTVDGDRWFQSRTVPMTGQDGDVTSLLVISRDITRLKETEEALARSERTFRALIEQNRDMVVVAEPDGTVRFVSSAVEEILGSKPEEHLGLSLVDCAHPSEVEQLDQIFERIVREPNFTPTVVFRAVRKDGTEIFLESRATNLLDDPAIAGIVVNTRDVTARTLAERQRERLEEQLRHAQKMEAVGRLAGGVAHDFNNLLTVIRGHVDLLLGGLPDDDPHRESAAEIERAAERAADLTRQLLAFGRRQVLRPRVLDLNRVIRELESMLRRLIGEHIELVVELDDRTPPVLADSGQIEQVIFNLAINARDAMATGGRLTIATEPAPSERTDRPPRVLLSVADTGSGMPPQVRDQVFEPFFTTKEQGSGLGLATVYGIVQQSGGEITVESAPGEGTVFHLDLPAAQGEPSRDPVRPVPDRTRHSATILLVEDEEAVRTLTANILSRAGYRVWARECGLEALDLLERDGETVDLLVTDLVMPSIGGYELARRAEALRPGIPVLYISGYPREELARHGVPEAEIPLLQKPFGPEELIARVGEALDEVEQAAR